MRNRQNIILDSTGFLRSILFNRFIVGVLATALTLIIVSPALVAAQDKGTNDRLSSEDRRAALRTAILDDIKNQDGRKEFSSEELDQMRSALFGLLDTIQMLAARRAAPAPGMGKSDGSQEKSKGGKFDSIREQILSLSNKDLTVLRAGLNPVKMQEKFAQSQEALKGLVKRELNNATVAPQSAGFPEVAPYCEDIPTTEEYRIAQIAVITAEGVRDVAQNLCNEVIVALGFGGNGRLACLITDAIYIVAKAATYDVTFCYEDYTGALTAANYARLDHVHGDLEDLKTSNAADFANLINTAATNTTTLTTAITSAQTAIVNNDNSNTTTIVNNDNSNATTLNTNLTNVKNMVITNDNTNTTNILANASTNTANIITNANTNTANIITNANTNTATLNTTITNAKNEILANANTNKTELKDLILRTQIEADLAEADNATFVGLYVTPASQGGYLDLTRSIVVDTITKLAGASTATANSFLAQADALTAAGNYKSAYQYYRKAYKAAVN